MNSCLLHGRQEFHRRLCVLVDVGVGLAHPLPVQIEPHQKILRRLAGEVGNFGRNLKWLSFLDQLISQIDLFYIQILFLLWSDIHQIELKIASFRRRQFGRQIEPSRFVHVGDKINLLVQILGVSQNPVGYI